MAFLKNKPLSCAKYFVEDIISADNNSRSECERPEASRGSKRRTSCCADCPPSPERVNQIDEAEGSDEEDHEERRRRKNAVYDRLYWNAHGSRATVLGGTATPEPPTTAEYVAHPKWRQHSPEKWVGGRPFTSTTLSSNSHTASRCSITGAPYSRTLLLDEPFAPAGITNSPTTPQARAYVRQPLLLHSPRCLAHSFASCLFTTGTLATHEDGGRSHVQAHPATRQEVLQLHVDGACRRLQGSQHRHLRLQHRASHRRSTSSACHHATNAALSIAVSKPQSQRRTRALATDPPNAPTCP